MKPIIVYNEETGLSQKGTYQNRLSFFQDIRLVEIPIGEISFRPSRQKQSIGIVLCIEFPVAIPITEKYRFFHLAQDADET